MKRLVLLFVIFSSFTTINAPKEQKILGNWKIAKLVYKEKISYNLYKERTSGTENKFRIHFNSNHTAVLSNPQASAKDTLQWNMTHKKITITYNGNHTLLKPLNGTHKIKALNNSRMELLDAAETTTIHFER
ncbi:MAG: hypothetical protein EOP00_35095 [Pedobacter sp.]|nr:MAG: hypothetical protein EOP00_35095 [Pedobacter sp.]